MNEQEKRRKQKIIVYYHCSRARKQGLPATLTVEQWLAILDDFHWKCAYCLEAPYEALDHFFPINPGISPLITKRGGTTADNCVPACNSCNKRKNADSPEYILKSTRSYSPGPSWAISSPYHHFPSVKIIKRISRYLKIAL